MCSTFNCLPNDILEENPLDVLAILDARNAKQAKEAFNNKKATDMPEFLIKLYKEITDAMRDKGYLE